MAVVSAINKSKSTGKKLNNFANKNQLYSFIKGFKKTKYFSSGSVDFDDDKA